MVITLFTYLQRRYYLLNNQRRFRHRRYRNAHIPIIVQLPEQWNYQTIAYRKADDDTEIK